MVNSEVDRHRQACWGRLLRATTRLNAEPLAGRRAEMLQAWARRYGEISACELGRYADWVAAGSPRWREYDEWQEAGRPRDWARVKREREAARAALATKGVSG